MIELLAYTALIGIVVTLFGGLLRFVFISYDRINGDGAITNEANKIMGLVMSKNDTSRFDYVTECDVKSDQCIKIIHSDEIQLSDEGIIEFIDTEETTIIMIENQNIKINDVILNDGNFRLTDDSTISFECPDSVSVGCQYPVITLIFSLVRVDSSGEALIDPVEFRNRFTFY